MNCVLESVSVRAPGKVILCGEHAVVHGAPAIVQSLQAFTQVKLEPTSDGSIAIDSEIGRWSFSKGSLELEPRLGWLGALLQRLCVDPTAGFKLTIESELAMGSGMGSSSAVIAATLVAFLKASHLRVTFEEAWEIAKEAEGYCHGKSSGIDLAASLLGGRLSFQEGRLEKLAASPLDRVYTYFSGKAQNSTAACVRQSSERIAQDPTLLASLWDVLKPLMHSLQEGSWQEQQALVRQWHRKLLALGVVPEAIQALIDSIEHEGGAAKISGGGSIHGPGAGLLLIWAPEALEQKLLARGLKLQPLEKPADGAWSTYVERIEHDGAR